LETLYWLLFSLGLSSRRLGDILGNFGSWTFECLASFGTSCVSCERVREEMIAKVRRWDMGNKLRVIESAEDD